MKNRGETIKDMTVIILTVLTLFFSGVYPGRTIEDSELQKHTDKLIANCEKNLPLSERCKMAAVPINPKMAEAKLRMGIN